MGLIKNANADVTETKTETATVKEGTVMSDAVVETKTSKDVAVAVPSTGSFWLATPSILQIVEEADTNTFERIVGSSGQLKLSSANKPIGQWVTFRAIAEKRKRTVSPNGAPGDQEAKNYFAAAYDNQLSSRGNEIEEDLQIAIDAGYSKAKIAEYIDLYVLVEDAADGKDADVAGEILVIQLAAVAKGTWISFKSGLQLKNELGILKFTGGQPPLIKAFAKADTNKLKQDFTTIKFSLV